MLDFKYIIKRVLVGLILFLSIFFLKKYVLLEVKAMTVSSVTVSSEDYLQVIDNMTRSITFGEPAWHIWTNSTGYVMGTFSVQKVSGSSTSTVISPRYVLARSNSDFSCQFGTVSVNNSTYVSQSYTYLCPVSLGSQGLNSIFVGFDGWQSNDTSTFRVEFNNNITIYNEQPQINFDTSSTTTAIESMEQSIIANQEAQTEAIIQSQQVCTHIDSSSIYQDNVCLNGWNNNGSLNDNSSYGITDYINILSSSIKVTTAFSPANSASGICFYNVNKSVISCIRNNSLSLNSYVTIPSGANYVRFSIQKSLNEPQFEICKNGNQALVDSNNQLNNTLNDDSIDSNTGEDFFDDFNYGDDTLSGVITAPLRFFNKLTDSCSPLTLSVYNENIVIPCGDTLFWNKPQVSSFRTWWNLFFGGIAIYFLALKGYKVVHDAIDPDKDNIETVGV